MDSYASSLPKKATSILSVREISLSDPEISGSENLNPTKSDLYHSLFVLCSQSSFQAFLKVILFQSAEGLKVRIPQRGILSAGGILASERVKGR